jgi:hypothetical protein
MKKTAIYYCLLLMLCSAWACSYRTEKIEEVEPVNPPNMLCPDKASAKEDQGEIAFEFRLMNTKGQVTNCFKEGEDVLFQLLMVNNTSERIHWAWQDKTFDASDLLKVYQVKDGAITRVGEQQKTGEVCYQVLHWGIQPQDTIKVATSWLGKSKTSFDDRQLLNPFIKNSPCHWAYLSSPDKPMKKGSYQVVFSIDFPLIKGENIFQNGVITDWKETSRELKKFNTTLSFQVN